MFPVTLCGKKNGLMIYVPFVIECILKVIKFSVPPPFVCSPYSLHGDTHLLCVFSSCLSFSGGTPLNLSTELSVDSARDKDYPLLMRDIFKCLHSSCHTCFTWPLCH